MLSLLHSHACFVSEESVKCYCNIQFVPCSQCVISCCRNNYQTLPRDLGQN